MCVANNTVAVILEPITTGSRITTITKPNWGYNVSYASLYGTSACLSGNLGTSDYNKIAADTLFDNGERVIGGEANGGVCFCRMTHPVQSRWVLYVSRNYGITGCTSECAGWCRNVNTINLMISSITD